MDLTKSQQEVIDLAERMPWKKVGGKPDMNVSVERSTSQYDDGPVRVEVTIRVNGTLRAKPKSACKHCGRYAGPSTYWSRRFVWKDGRFQESVDRKRPYGRWSNKLKARLAGMQAIIDQGHV